MYKEIKEADLEKKIIKIEQADQSMRYMESWNLINEISGRKNTQMSQLNGRNGEERTVQWYEHFKNLLGSTPSVTHENEEITTIFRNLNINDKIFTLEEYAKAKDGLKCGKSAGEDGIMSEVLKYVPIDDIVLEIINESYSKHEQPDLWNISIIVPIPKSGDLTKADNYRGISLTSVMAKTYNRMLLNRIRPIIDPMLRPNQNGFRQNRTTVGQILALRRIFEGVKARNLTSIVTFIDFKKAFDSIHRGKMIKVLEAYGIPERIVRAISTSYSNTRAKVYSPDGVTEEFNIVAGVLQGDTLAPYLFIIILDYALRKAINGREEELGFTITPRKSRRHNPITITDLDFADDIALISNNAEQASKLLLSVEAECKKMGLCLNAKKTKAMSININNPALKTNEGHILEIVENFKYLGAWMLSSDIDIRTRKALAWNALHGMKTLWNSSISLPLKRRLFVATVESVMLYGAEAWTLSEQQLKSLNGTYTRMLRKALRIGWDQHMTNRELYGHLPPVSVKVRTRRMRLAGHGVRHSELTMNPLILWEPTHGKSSSKGRQRLTYLDMLRKDTGLTESQEIKTMMLERNLWRKSIIRMLEMKIEDPPRN